MGSGREPERMQSMCEVESGSSEGLVLLLPTLLLDECEMGRMGIVSRSGWCWCWYFGMAEDRVPSGSGGGGELLRLPLRFPCEASWGLGDVAVARRCSTDVSDLYRGRGGGIISVAAWLTFVNAERDRRRPFVYDGTNNSEVGKMAV